MRTLPWTLIGTGLALFVGCAAPAEPASSAVGEMTSEASVFEETQRPSGTITFSNDGDVDVEGVLVAGGTATIRYGQERLDRCRQTQGGNPVWSISGYASVNGERARAFSTGRPDGPNFVTVDAVVDLPSSGDLALWFDATSISGCHEVDSLDGKNYHFPIK